MTLRYAKHLFRPLAEDLQRLRERIEQEMRDENCDGGARRGLLVIDSLSVGHQSGYTLVNNLSI